MAKSMHKWYPVKFNFIMENSNSDNLLSLDLIKLAEAKKKPDSTQSFADTLKDLSNSRFEFESNEKNLQEDLEKDASQIIEENEEIMMKDMEKMAADEEARTKEVPLYIKLQKKCMDLCVHLISHPSKKVRILGGPVLHKNRKLKKIYYIRAFFNL